jgi:hypothetical protein
MFVILTLSLPKGKNPCIVLIFAFVVDCSYV